MIRSQAPAVLVRSTLNDYSQHLKAARMQNPRAGQNLSPDYELVLKYAQEVNRLKAYRLSQGVIDRKVHLRLAKRENVVVGGFMLLSGELMGLWGPGIGDWLMRDAVSLGADRLDCFDGFLPGWYSRHGFQEILRAPNFTEGGPDVVWMRRP